MVSPAQGKKLPSIHRRERVARAGAGSALAVAADLPRRVDTSCSSSAAEVAAARPRRVRPEGAASCKAFGAAAARPRLLRAEAASAASLAASSSADLLLPRPRPPLAGAVSSAAAAAAAPRLPRPAGLGGSLWACPRAGSGSAEAELRLPPRLAAGLQRGICAQSQAQAGAVVQLTTGRTG